MKLKHKAFIALGLSFALAVLIVYVNTITFFPCGSRLSRSEARELTLLAEQGDTDACSRLRFHYGAIGDKEKARYWLRKGVEYGDPKAQSELSYQLMETKNPKFYKESMELLEKAASNNYPEAQLELGEYYRDGKYVELRSDKAEYWLQKSANNGLQEGMLSLSELLTKKANTKSDLVEAYKWTMIALSRIKQKTMLSQNLELQQEAIMNKASVLGYSLSALKRDSEAKMKAAEKDLPQYRPEPPVFGSRTCIRN